MKKKNAGSGSLFMPELKEVVKRMKGKEKELDAVVKRKARKTPCRKKKDTG
ncbi:MAG: hypothetical protein PHU49_07960 [Syntrophorhabdaceae bacterium]|nr:hypothetical protein [Syntrophorhabdaceae bacterium]MDD5243938.1 hypothetical protein [Syntrophorhabdaceae bacterium]